MTTKQGLLRAILQTCGTDERGDGLAGACSHREQPAARCPLPRAELPVLDARMGQIPKPDHAGCEEFREAQSRGLVRQRAVRLEAAAPARGLRLRAKLARNPRWSEALRDASGERKPCREIKRQRVGVLDLTKGARRDH